MYDVVKIERQRQRETKRQGLRELIDDAMVTAVDTDQMDGLIGGRTEGSG